MSRIGKKPIPTPANVKVGVAGRKVVVESGAKKLAMTHRPEVTVKVDEGARAVVVGVAPGFEEQRAASAYWGTTRALISNMIKGVTQGYEKTMEIVGVGWGAEVRGKELVLKVGFASPVTLPIAEGLSVTVEKQFVRIKGPDKQSVGQLASVMRSVRKPEPYNGKGIKYADEVIRRKQGKVFGS